MLNLSQQINQHFEMICSKEQDNLNKIPDEINDDYFERDLDFEFSDELNFLSLLYSCLEKLKAANNENDFELLHKLCTYFNKRFNLYSKIKECMEHVSEYKYKT